MLDSLSCSDLLVYTVKKTLYQERRAYAIRCLEQGYEGVLYQKENPDIVKTPCTGQSLAVHLYGL